MCKAEPVRCRLLASSVGVVIRQPGAAEAVGTVPQVGLGLVEGRGGARRALGPGTAAAGEERAAVWKTALAFWPPYATYQARVEREIRLHIGLDGAL